jgi:hypothetical protein
MRHALFFLLFFRQLVLILPRQIIFTRNCRNPRIRPQEGDRLFAGAGTLNLIFISTHKNASENPIFAACITPDLTKFIWSWLKTSPGNLTVLK